MEGASMKKIVRKFPPHISAALRGFIAFFALLSVMALYPGMGFCEPVTLAWDANQESDLKGYILYYGTSSGNYSSNIDVGNVTQYTTPDLQDGVTFYFAVTAYNDADMESDYSEELAHTVGVSNEFPTTPTTSGNTSDGYLNTDYSFSTSATDPDGDLIEYKFDWGDETQSSWGTASRSHAWSTTGTFCIKARARDSYGGLSGWSDCHSIAVAERTHSITASAGSPGSIVPSGHVTVTHGSSQTFTIRSEYVPEGFGEDVLSQSGKIWIEAEIGSLMPPMVLAEDDNSSSGQFIHIPVGNGNIFDPTQDGGYAEYTFEVPVSGEYLIWGRVNATDFASDSFYVSVDGADYVEWHIQVSNNWIWDQVSNGGDRQLVVFNLEKGQHTLTVKQRESGAKIDRILVINREGSNYQVQDVLVDGQSVGAVDSYTFENVTDAHSIEALFAQAPSYTINASAGANGSISPAGTVKVNSGADKTFTIAADQNFQVAAVYVDGSSQGAVTSYTFENVTKNHTISASFLSINQKPNADAGADLTVTEGTVVNLIGGNSSDPGGTIVAYAWEQIDGPTVQIYNSGSKTASFTAPDVGIAGDILSFRLTVTDDGHLTDVDTCTVAITKDDVVDSDGDGVPDDQDDFPYDADEHQDTDGDGEGDNADSDDDNDGMPDDWELTYGLNPLEDDAGDDPDGDDVSNINEYNLGSAPNHAEGNFKPEAPVLLNPENGASVTLNPLLQTGDFDDPNVNDGHSKTQWVVMRAFDDVCVFDVTSDASLTALNLPNHVLEEDTEYLWKARFIDNHNTPSEWSEEREFVSGFAEHDSDKNGVPDVQEVGETVDLDEDGTVDIFQTDIKCVSFQEGENEAQICISIKGAENAESIVSMEVQDPADPELNSASNGKPNYFEFGLLDFKILVRNPGDETTVIIYLSKAAFEKGNCFKYDPVNKTWLDYSGYTEFSPDRKMVFLTLKDGGFGDADGIENGIIVDPLAFGSETDPSGSGSDSPVEEIVDGILPFELSCFISAAAPRLHIRQLPGFWQDYRSRGLSILLVAMLLVSIAGVIIQNRKSRSV